MAVDPAPVLARVATACERVGRDPGDVGVIAVSKLQPVDAIRHAYELGVRDFGENFAQELRDKAAALVDLSDIRWHAIGHLQTNKAKYVARVSQTFHALDRVEVAEALTKHRTGDPLRCYIEVNIADEATKSGVAPEEAAGLVDACSRFHGIRVVGLMTMPPFLEDAEASRPYFRQLQELAEELELPELSMGTTHDFEVAIEEGATVVRVGTAIFGDRPRR